jgi:hypothetical protein
VARQKGNRAYATAEGLAYGEPFCDSVAEKPRRWAKTPAS